MCWGRRYLRAGDLFVIFEKNAFPLKLAKKDLEFAKIPPLQKKILECVLPKKSASAGDWPERHDYFIFPLFFN